MKKHAVVALLSVAVGVGDAPQAFADGRDAIAGFIVGLGVAAAVSSSQKKKRSSKSSKSSTKKSSSKSYAQRGDSQIQAALNFYGFDAGTPDGVFGPATRAAIKRYQAAVGEAQTGSMTPAQTSALLTAYLRDSSHGTSGTIGAPSTGNGQMSALLASLSVQDTLKGAGATTLPGQATVVTESNAPSAAQLCEGKAGASEGETLAGAYCSALGHAVNHSLTLTKALPSFDAAVSGKQCDDWLAANAAAVNAALAQPPEAAVTALLAVAPGSDAAQKAAMMDSFAICHGIAEAAGNAEGARSYAALVAAFGGGGYGELVGASAALGLGTTQAGAAASDWYLWTAEALDGGSAKLIDTPDYDHVPLLLALAESAKTNTQDWQAVLTARSQPAGLALPGITPAAAPAGGLALPGLPAPTAVTEANAPTAPALPANFQELYGMTPEAALAACRQGGAAIVDLGRVTCRAIAASVGDSLLAAQYQ